MLKPFSLTYVQYEENDQLGLLLSIITLSPIFIIVIYGFLILTNPNIKNIMIIIGQFINLVINHILKKILKQPRPVDCELDSYGMPSNHSQFIIFIGIIYIKHLYNDICYKNEQLIITSNQKLINKIQFQIYKSKLFIFIIIIGSFLVCYSRVYLNYHTSFQVIIGTLLGLLMGFIWILFIESIYGNKLSMYIYNLPICEYLQVQLEYNSNISFNRNIDVVKQKININ
jgi:dolichyldiphosphatase